MYRIITLFLILNLYVYYCRTTVAQSQTICFEYMGLNFIGELITAVNLRQSILRDLWDFIERLKSINLEWDDLIPSDPLKKALLDSNA